MDKQELIDRLNAATNSASMGTNISCERMLKKLVEDVRRWDIPAGEDIVSPPVDYFAEWVEGTDLRFGECEDFSVKNPKLHELYTNWAHHHLLVIGKAIKRLNRFSNLNLADTLVALNKCRRELIASNTAYRDAAARIVAGIAPNEYTPEAADGSSRQGAPIVVLKAVENILDGVPNVDPDPEELADAIKELKELFK